MTEGTDSYVYTYNQFNQLKMKTKNGQADSSYEYDARGNQTKKITKKKIDDVLKDVTSSYKYDLANRLERVDQTITGEEPVVEQNFYNGDGQRIRRDVNGVVSKYFYDGDNLLYTTDINNNKATENVLSPDGAIVASKRFDGVYDNMYFFYQYDIRGSVTSILDPDAKRVKGYGYDEFGDTEEVGSQSFINDVKFTGAVHDTATGLYYMNARHYNPDTGRFISQDTYKGTASDPWSQHLYTYTTNNPVNYVDPTGHLPIYIDENGLTQTAKPKDIPKSSWPGNNKIYHNNTPNSRDPFLNGSGSLTDEQLEEIALSILPGGKGRKLLELGEKSIKNLIKILFKSKGGANAVRTFTSKDPLVGELANFIERAIPGSVSDVNRIIKDQKGRIVTDFDIELKNIIIQVKSGGGKGLTSQLQKTADATNKIVIGYGPDIKQSVIRGTQEKGFNVFRDQDELIEFIRKNK